VGTAKITGTNSALSTVLGIFVGYAGGKGTLIVENGGKASTPGPVAIGFSAPSTGDVTVSGTNALLDCDSLYVGGSSNAAGGTGVLNVINGGTLNATNSLVIWDTANTKVNLTGGTINAAALNFHGNPSLLNWTTGKLHIKKNVTFDPNAADTSTSAAFGSARQLDANQTLQITGNETLGGGGQFTLTVNTGGKNIVSGNLAVATKGTLDLAAGGTVAVGNVGAIVPAAGSVLIGTGGIVSGTGTIKGAVVNNSGAVQPGASAGLLHITGPYTQAAGGALQIEIGGTTRGTQYDALLADGQASLGGTLQVSLINSFTPALNNSFDILDALSITGPFATISVPALSGSLAWDTLQLYTTGQLIVGLPGDYNHDNTVNAADYIVWRISPYHTQAQYDLWRANFGAVASLAGDYNNNGAVDAADYVLWRKGGPLANEVDTPGVVNAADYDAWRARFGSTGSGSGAGAAILGATGSASAAVPEPAGVYLVLMATAATLPIRRRRRSNDNLEN
jgi:T5SS/PEP-CTERM-associated repeat protein